MLWCPMGKQQFADNNLVKERAKNIKWRALETLDQHLEEFEMHFTARGGKVIWAQDSQEALDEILNICKEKNCKTGCEKQEHGYGRNSSEFFFAGKWN